MTAGVLPGPIHAFSGQDLPHLLETRARNRTDHPFLIYAPFDSAPSRWTYGEFHAGVCRLAGGLAANGVVAGDYVLIHMDNCVEFVLSWHACSRIGAVAVTTNTRSSVDELHYFAEHCGAKFAITEPALETTVRQSAPWLNWVAVTESDGGALPDQPRSEVALPFEALATGDPTLVPLRDADPLRFNSVQYTSGTTSRPKGVVWTHANALWGGRQGAAACALTADDIGHTCLPLYHTNALSYSHLSTLWAGATLVFQRRFSASRYWPCVVDHGCTWGVQIPFILKALMERDVPKHRLTRWGLGGVDPPSVLRKFGVPCIGWFGMTETVSLPLVSTSQLPGRVGSMGSPTPGYEIEVRREDGAHVTFGESGMLWIRGVRGLSLFQEYLKNPEATSEAFDDAGWFRTGDRVTPHPDGVVFDGRDRDMLRVGAENVAESEVERVLLGTGLVTEVAVVGKPHPMLDEVPVAFVTCLDPSSDPTDALLAACRSKLADFKLPAEIILVDDFPRVTLGKIDKKALRREMADRVKNSR